MRRALSLLLAVGGLVLVAPAQAQRGDFEEAYSEPGANPAYDGRFTFARIRYDMPDGIFRRGRGDRRPPWAHDYPRGERNLTAILAEITMIRPRTAESVVLALSDPDLFKYPVSYMSEPGFWQASPADATALGAYLLKGGFIIFDDFRDNDWYNLEEQMRRVLPDARWIKIDGTHQIFDSFYRIPAPESLHSYGPTEPTFWAIFEGNDPKKRMLALANRDNDLSEVWEFSGTGLYPVDVTNEAYKIGVNYIIYALSR